MGEVVVVGSANLDLVVPVERHPLPGETLLGGALRRHPGGKGANQAVAASLAGGASTVFLGCLANDEAGAILRDSLSRAEVDTSHISSHAGASGVALIWVTPDGGNTILVAPGSNRHLNIDETSASIISSSKVVLAQLEIPLSSVIAAGRACSDSTTFILNAAPSCDIPDELIELVDVLVVNEHEADDLSDAPGAPEELAVQLQQRFRNVVVTLGPDGSLLADERGITRIPAFRVEATDTTGAGDTFCGALAGAIARGDDMVAALTHASAAGALAATRPGAQESVPTRAEVETFVQNAR